MAAFHTDPARPHLHHLVPRLPRRTAQDGRPCRPHAVRGVVREAGLGLFEALGHYSVLGVVLAVLLVVGLSVAWLPLARSGAWTELRRRCAEPAALWPVASGSSS